MPENRFYLDAPLQPGERHRLSVSEQRHLRVMRLAQGEGIELVNGRGQIARATIDEDDVEIASVHFEDPPEPLILCQAIPKMNRLDTIVEKGTELGMTALWLFPGEKSEKKTLTDNQLERLRAVSIAAMKQSGALYLPTIEVHPPLRKWKELPKQTYVGDLSPSTPPFGQIWQPGPTALVIGPESGLTQNELKILIDLGAWGMRLHPQILRTDTAPLAALALVSHWRLINSS